MPREQFAESVDWFADGVRHLWRPYTQMQTAALPLPVSGTSGVRIHLEDGRSLIDGISSWWTACHGYNHPAILEAVRAQLESMPHIMLGGLTHAPACRLAARLAAVLPGDLEHVFFSESGSVSVEVAMKMALQYWRLKGQSKNKFLSFLGGYHGDTMGTMSICDPEEGMHQLFADAIPSQYVLPLPVTEEKTTALIQFIEANHTDIAALVMEPLVQAAGGMHFHTPSVVKQIRNLCDRFNILLILDEIATGFGRTGTMFACEQAQVVPDIICLSKALTGGTMALAATVARSHVFEAFLGESDEDALMHGPTFMGNPLACAAANASLDLFVQEDRLTQASQISSQLKLELEPCRSLSGVVDVRVLGAVAAIELVDAPNFQTLTQEFIDRGVWIRPIGKIVYLMPPLVIEADDLRVLTKAIVDVLQHVLRDSP
jgi:adenosylmethionine---8-amino-7-oxononanoate aminotransferase